MKIIIKTAVTISMSPNLTQQRLTFNTFSWDNIAEVKEGSEKNCRPHHYRKLEKVGTK